MPVLYAGSVTRTQGSTTRLVQAPSLLGFEQKTRIVTPLATAFNYGPAGGLILGGSSTASKAKSYAPTGGLVFGGAATLFKTKVYQPSGGLQTGGTGLWSRLKIYVASGMLAFGGAVQITRAKVAQVSGGIILAGAAIAGITLNSSVRPNSKIRIGF